MTDGDDKRFALAIGTLAEAFQRSITAATIGAYRLGLSDLAIEVIEKAAAHAIRRCRFMPSAAEIRQLAAADEPSPEDRAVRAWSAVMGCLGRFDYYASVEFDDPCIHATIRTLGGWLRFWERLEGESRKWLRKEFEKTYLALLRTGWGPGDGGYLPGSHELNNRLHGFELPAIQRISTGVPAALPAPVRQQSQQRQVTHDKG